MLSLTFVDSSHHLNTKEVNLWEVCFALLILIVISTVTRRWWCFALLPVSDRLEEGSQANRENQGWWWGGGTHLSLHLGGGEVLCQWPHWISCKTFIVLSFANLTFHKANKFSPYEYLWVHHPGIESWIPNVSKQSIKTPLEIFAYVNKIAEFKIGKTNGQQICFYR